MVAGGRKSADAALIAALAGGATVRDAAATARVGEMTVYRRLREPDFRRRVDEARAAMLACAVGRLAEAATAAALTLRSLLAKETPPAVRLGSARSILELAVRLREHDELAARVAALEARVAPEQEAAWPRRTG